MGVEMYEGPAACTYQNPLDLKRGLLSHNLQNKAQGELGLGYLSALGLRPGTCLSLLKPRCEGNGAGYCFFSFFIHFFSLPATVDYV